jgi:glycosyltransferase involved in cell wall biosynthesis
MNNITVSVIMMTYSHEPYIIDAIEGVRIQNCNFNVELIIANDNSPDGTKNKVEDYLNSAVIPKNIDIKYFQHEKNKGANSNYLWASKKAKGTYIANCEGDDYWTDPLKLQKQVDFLEANFDFTGIGTNSKVLIEETQEHSFFKNAIKDEVLLTDDFLKSRFFHTASFMYRNNITLPDKFISVLSGDRLLFLLIATYGKVFYKNEVTCVYRKNIGGISKRVTSSQMIKDLNFFKIVSSYLDKNQLKILNKFILKTIFEYSHSIKLSHFIRVSIKLLLVSGFDYKTRRLLKKNFKKVEI